MKMIILSSNVSKINETKKGKVINMVCLQGRKINDMSIGLVRSLRGGRCVDWGVIEAQRVACGILVF